MGERADRSAGKEGDDPEPRRSAWTERSDGNRNRKDDWRRNCFGDGFIDDVLCRRRRHKSAVPGNENCCCSGESGKCDSGGVHPDCGKGIRVFRHHERGKWQEHDRGQIQEIDRGERAALACNAGKGAAMHRPVHADHGETNCGGKEDVFLVGDGLPHLIARKSCRDMKIQDEKRDGYGEDTVAERFKAIQASSSRP